MSNDCLIHIYDDEDNCFGCGMLKQIVIEESIIQSSGINTDILKTCPNCGFDYPVDSYNGKDCCYDCVEGVEPIIGT